MSRRLPTDATITTGTFETALGGSKSTVASTKRGVALVGISAFFFSVMSALVKVLGERIQSFEVVFFRSGVAWCLILICLGARRRFWWRRRRKSHFVKLSPDDDDNNDHHLDAAAAAAAAAPPPIFGERKMWRMCLWRSFFGFGGLACAFWAFQQLALADASVIVFTSPIFTMIVGYCVLGERVGARDLASALLALAGVVLVVRPAAIFGSSEADAGNILPTAGWKAPRTVACVVALLAAVSAGCAYVTIRRIKGVDTLVIINWFSMFSTITALMLALTTQSFVVPTSRELLLLFGTGLCGFFGQLTMTKGFQLEKAGRAAIMRYLDVVFVFCWDIFLLRESISRYSIAGSALILCCTLSITLNKSKEAPPLPPQEQEQEQEQQPGAAAGRK